MLLYSLLKAALTLYVAVLLVQWIPFIRHLLEMIHRSHNAKRDYLVEIRMRELAYEQYP